MDGINGIQGGIRGALAPHAVSPHKGKDSPGEVKKALQDFEALFINQMLKVMRESVGKSELFHGGSGEDIYSSLFDTELSKLMSRGSGIGLGGVLAQQLTGKEAQAPPQTGRPVVQGRNAGVAALEEDPRQR
ncbi:MAG: rod-binding protein [Thermodesulfobacteriota bacterium]